MPVHVTAHRDGDGHWTLERDGHPLVGLAPVSDEELVERLEELVLGGQLTARDRIAVVGVDEKRTLRRIEEFLRLGDRADRRRELASVEAERYASEEHYV